MRNSIKPKFLKWFLNENLYATIDKKFEFHSPKLPKLIFYKIDKYKVMLWKSSSGKSLRIAIRKEDDVNNILTIFITPHFIERFNERIGVFSPESIIFIMIKVCYKYIGLYTPIKDKGVHILYPMNHGILKIVASESTNHLNLRTCYKRTEKSEKFKLDFY